tara:strand:+ start:2673 stop:3305 length:633 start_codon:yes stop_codon:yes gene_type:complete
MSDPKRYAVFDEETNTLIIVGPCSSRECNMTNPLKKAGINKYDPSLRNNKGKVLVNVKEPRKDKNPEYYIQQMVKDLFRTTDLNEFTTEALLKRATDIFANKPKDELSRKELIAILKISYGIENDETYENYHHLMTRTVESDYTVSSANAENYLNEEMGSVNLLEYDHDTHIATFKLNDESFPEQKKKYRNSVIHFEFPDESEPREIFVE